MRSAAFLDANVLYPAILRSVLLELALKKAYRLLWSAQVHQEWTTALLRNNPQLDPMRIARTRALMEAHLDDAMVTGFEPLIPTLVLPDPDDRHIPAAAIHGGASVIVTLNLRHFPPSILAQHNLAVAHPDEFIARIVDAGPALAIEAFATDRGRLRNPAMTIDQYLAALEQAGLAETVVALRGYVKDL